MQALFDLLSRFGQPLLLIGGHALAAHGVPRQTVDVDCIVALENREAISRHVRGGGFELIHETENFNRYAHPSPMVPDLDLLFVEGPTFDKLQAQSIQTGRIRVPALPHLIALKLHAIRNNPTRELRDLGDIQRLLAANPGIISNEELNDLCRRFGPPGIEAKLL